MFEAVVMDYAVVSPFVLASVIEREVGVCCNWKDVRGGEAFRLWVMDEITTEQSGKICAICARFEKEAYHLLVMDGIIY